MSHELIARLAALDAVATPGPWHHRPLNDDVCMSAVGVAIEPDHYHDEHGFNDPNWPTGKLVAVCLLQEPPLAIPEDRRWDANAELIAELRSALPELLRLARIGIDASPA